MSLSISRSRIKEKCGVTDTSLDTIIDNLILELTPVIEQMIRPDALENPAAGVQATLTLGATEIVCGEFLSQQLRAGGAADCVTIGDLKVQPNLSLPTGLVVQGYERLSPFLIGTSSAAIVSRVGIAQAETAEVLRVG
jgi:hypothetical protein